MPARRAGLVSFKICVIGAGWMATQGHGPSYRSYALTHPGVELAACCDMDAKKASDFQVAFGFAKHYTDIFAMLDKERPDAVCLTVPVELTAELAIRILEAGYPLMMEKPPGMNPGEAQAIALAAEKAKTPHQVAFNRRFMPLVRRLRSDLENVEASGPIQNLQYTMLRSGRLDEDFSTTAIHGIDAAKFLAGSDYDHVRFTYQELPEQGAGVANIFLDCGLASGASAQLRFCPVAGAVLERAEVNCSGHTFLLELPIWGGFDSPGRLLHLRDNRLVSLTTGLDVCDTQEMFVTNGFYGENASFFEDIRSGRMPVDDVRSSLQSVEIAACIRTRRAEWSMEC